MAGEFNLEAVLTGMDGKIDLIKQAVDTAKEDMILVRERVHGLSNEVQKLIALNLPGTLLAFREDISKLDNRVLLLEHDFHQRRGAVNMAKVLYGLGGGASGAAIVAAALKLAGAI